MKTKKVEKVIKNGFHYTTNDTSTIHKQSDHKVELSFFKVIALY